MDAFTPKDEENMAALVSKPLFDELMDLYRAAHPEKNIEVDWGGAIFGTCTYYVPTVYESEPHPDPLSVGQD